MSADCSMAEPEQRRELEDLVMLTQMTCQHSMNIVRRVETCVKYASIEMFRKWRELHDAHFRTRIKVNSPVEKSLGKPS